MRAPLPTQYVHALSLWHPGLAAAIGGTDSGSNTLDTVEAFNGLSWSTVEPMPSARSMLGVGALGSTLYGM